VQLPRSATAPPSKLAPKYFGPYKVLQCIGEVAYKLQLPKRARIHDVFHVTFLKKFEGSAPTEVPPLPPIARGRVVPQPNQVIRARPTTTSWELLVKWQGRNAAETSWEGLEQLKEAYPDFVVSTGGGKCYGHLLWQEIFQEEGRCSCRTAGLIKVTSRPIKVLRHLITT
jgi:hypothetical protein